jgi:hypothetical protein
VPIEKKLKFAMKSVGAKAHLFYEKKEIYIDAHAIKFFSPI